MSKAAMTYKQECVLRHLCREYGVTFNPSDYTPQFDLPAGYVAGWIGGDPNTIYVGVDVDGRASS